MKTAITALLLLLSSSAFAFGVLSGESEDGMNKICYYDTPSGTVAITIKAYKVCPTTID